MQMRFGMTASSNGFLQTHAFFSCRQRGNFKEDSRPSFFMLMRLLSISVHSKREAKGGIWRSCPGSLAPTDLSVISSHLVIAKTAIA